MQGNSSLEIVFGGNGNGFLDLENVGNTKITQIHETQSSVYPRTPTKPEVDQDFHGHPNMVAL